MLENIQKFPSTATGKQSFNPTATDNCNWSDADALLSALSDVVNADPRWRPWYCKRFMSMTRDEVLKRASIARADGKDRKRYFSLLLKQSSIIQA